MRSREYSRSLPPREGKTNRSIFALSSTVDNAPCTRCCVTRFTESAGRGSLTHSGTLGRIVLRPGSSTLRDNSWSPYGLVVQEPIRVSSSPLPTPLVGFLPSGKHHLD